MNMITVMVWQITKRSNDSSQSNSGNDCMNEWTTTRIIPWMYEFYLNTGCTCALEYLSVLATTPWSLQTLKFLFTRCKTSGFLENGHLDELRGLWGPYDIISHGETRVVGFLSRRAWNGKIELALKELGPLLWKEHLVGASLLGQIWLFLVLEWALHLG